MVRFIVLPKLRLTLDSGTFGLIGVEGKKIWFAPSRRASGDTGAGRCREVGFQKRMLAFTLTPWSRTRAP